MKLPFPRRFKAWLVALVSLTAVAVVSIAPMMRPRAQAPPTTYTITDLGTLGTGTYSRALGINNCGQIVGESSVTGASPTHPFIWRNGVMSDLGTLGGARGLAVDINASGLVVGTSTIANGDERAFRWFDLDGDGTPDSGEMIDLGVLPNYSHHGAYGVNDNGQIVGSAESSFGPASGFIWNANTGLQLLATLDGIEPSHGYAINNSSHIAGYARNVEHAFVYNGTTNIDLGTFGGPGSGSIAYDINAAGHAVGFADVDASTGSPPRRAFKWTGTLPLQDLGVLTGGVRSQAKSINSSGIVVGYSEVDAPVNLPPTRHAFVHEAAQMYDLNNMVPNLPAGWVLQQANAINDGGQIVGEACTTNDCSSPTPSGQIRAFLLTPTTFTPSCSPTVTVSVSSPESVLEDGAPNLTFTFTRAPVTSTPVTVSFSTSGSATPAVDYALSGAGITYDPNTGSGMVAFAAGEITKSVTVNPATDFAVEPNETVVLTTNAGTGYIVGTPTSATGTINNDDTIPSVSVAVSPLTAGEDGSDLLTYTFTRSTVTTSPLIVKFATTGTATAASDYSILPAGTVTIPANMASATVTVDPSVDTTDEPDETVILTISADAAYTIAAAPQHAASGTITDDDASPTIQITNVTGPEPPSGSSIFTFTVSLTHPSSSQITVNYATDTTGGTATGGANCGGGVDFFNIPLTALPFEAGETSKLVHVPVCTDSALEPDETFFVNLSGNSANSNLATVPKGTGTITPQTPAIFVEAGTETNPIPTAALVDSVTFARGPFQLINNNNLSNDQPPATRIIIFTSNLGMTNADLASGILSVRFNGSAIPLANIEHVGPVGVLGGSYIIVKLPPLPTGPNTLTVKMGGAESNATTLSIIP